MEAEVNTVTTRTVTRASELLSLLDEYPSIKVLSLDCFDTLIWRKTTSPVDVFYNLQHRPTFKSLGFSARMREKAEGRARDKMVFSQASSEVRLKDIYLAAFPNLTADQLANLMEEELQEEIASCYALPAMLDFMRAAHARKIKIIIASDTYLEEPQLRKILETTLPADAMSMISKIFVSCEHGKSKSQGLHAKIREKLQLNPRTILHIGDHITADFEAPKKEGLNAVYLKHQLDQITDLLRMQSVAGGFLDTNIRHLRGLVCPYRGVLAGANLSEDKPESMIGYASIGQIMHAFGRFICDETARLRAQGKRVKVLFLMRDAYLPSLVCEAIAGNEIGKRVRISRFSAHAASFHSKDEIDKYLCDNAASERFMEMCKQLMLPESIASKITANANAAKHPPTEFIHQIRQPDILQTIMNESKAHTKRLIQHLKNEVNLERGDSLLFVDLGYSGTAQLLLEPVLRAELDVSVHGCYLIALRTPGWENSRRGLLDPSWCDDRTIHTLVEFIALLEQICTTNESSSIGYDEQGNPVYSETTISQQQHNKLRDIQSECLRFVRDAEKFFAASGSDVSLAILRDAALAELGRLLFFPSQAEINYLQSFQFDLNMGTKDLLGVIDVEKGLTGLRRRGITFMEKNVKTMRTNYPAELRAASVGLAITMLSQYRVGFRLKINDMSLLRMQLNVIFIRNGQASQKLIEAIPTNEGYYALLVPVGQGNIKVGIQFGLACKWVQIESTELIATHSLYGHKESDHTIDAANCMMAEKMSDKSGGLFECENETSLLIYNPDGKEHVDNQVLRVIFRPVVERKKN